MALVPTWLGTQVLPWPYCTNFKGWLLCDKDSCNPTGKAVLLANMHSLNLSPGLANMIVLVLGVLQAFFVEIVPRVLGNLVPQVLCGNGAHLGEHDSTRSSSGVLCGNGTSCSWQT